MFYTLEKDGLFASCDCWVVVTVGRLDSLPSWVPFPAGVATTHSPVTSLSPPWTFLSSELLGGAVGVTVPVWDFFESVDAGSA